MLIATFNDTTGWAGKTITREGDAFILQDHGPVTAAYVMEYDRQGHLEWASDVARRWVTSRATPTRPVESKKTRIATYLEGSPHAGQNLFRMTSRLMLDDGRRMRAYEVSDHDEAGYVQWESDEFREKVRQEAEWSVLARFADWTEYPGSLVTLDNWEYVIEGHREISATEFTEHRRAGRLVWASEEVRSRQLAARIGAVIAVFTAPEGEAGQAITFEDGQFVLEGHGEYTAEKVVAFDSNGQLNWLHPDVRTAIHNDARAELEGSSFAYRRIPDKARRIYDANSGPKEVDFLIFGVSNQCLIGLKDSCIIVKPGFMAGATGGGRFTEFHYVDVSGVEVNTGITSAVLEVTTPAYQGRSKDWWSAGKNEDPFKVSNCLPGSKALFSEGEGAVNIEELRRRVRQAKQAPASTAPPTQVDPAEQIRKLADLRDAGVLTPEEFEEAKRKILGAL